MADDTGKKTTGKKSPKNAKRKGGLGLFFRQVIEQLRKVVYPTKKQLVTYSIVVLIFVLFMMAYIGGLDWVFREGIQRAFGAE
ncbi:preprotein translocase subunit SecE [Salininema proteolyticum]|uniref:Protein translocase subunit SecE n=1 Tax=Salininema proteolyticum TaxID=1607685 RepID=A0ABV8TZ95_9ACTN